MKFAALIFLGLISIPPSYAQMMHEGSEPTCAGYAPASKQMKEQTPCQLANERITELRTRYVDQVIATIDRVSADEQKAAADDFVRNLNEAKSVAKVACAYQ